MEEPGDDLDNLCPLCMEEMDPTDRRLRPCQCGYQICVWCWHQVMELASKDNSEGRCPACRTPYDKDKVVGARCEELMDVSVEKKKSHKTKSKSQEGRKHLSTVRVVQRNLVYVVGIPLSHADEETLERREFFGQYGKILKVAVSRAGQHAHGAGATASVYVTYVRDEDALKCIKAVDGCIFEGKLLRACFGTNKYCNAWLKYASCNNPDCMYLHDEGLDEDSYTKEEMLVKYGSKTQYFHELTKPPHRAVGPGLPPPPPETSAPVQSHHGNNLVKGTAPRPVPSVSSSGKVASLPAAASWGLRGGPTKTPPKTSTSVPGKRKPCLATSGPRVTSKDLDEEGANAAISFSQGSSSPEAQAFAIASSSDMQQPGGIEMSSEIQQGCDGSRSLSWNDAEAPSKLIEDSTQQLSVGGNVGTPTAENSDAEHGRLASTSDIPGSEGGRQFSDGYTDDVITVLERMDFGGDSDLILGGVPSTSPATTGSNSGKPQDNNIISDILSMDMTEGAADLSKYLKTFDDTSESPWRPQAEGRQSRFSFARQESCSMGGPSFDEQRCLGISFGEQYGAREPFVRSSMHSSVADFSGQGSASKSRLFAPPGFASNCSVPPPGFSVRNVPNRPQSPAARFNEFELMDPAIMAVGRGAIQTDLSSRLRAQPKPDVRQLLPSSSNVDEMLGLISHQHPHLDFEAILKQQQQQQQQQQRLLSERKLAFKFPGDPLSTLVQGDAGRMTGQFEESSPFSPSANRGYRGAPLESNWLGYGGDAFSPEMSKFKSSLRGGHSSSSISASLKHTDGKGMLFNGNPQSLEHYLNEPSFREADIQGYV